MKLQHSLFLVPCSIFILFSCSVSKKISKQADALLLNDTAISTGHIGISIYEPATNTYWYNYNADKYFIPASNTKLFTLYAGMKYLGDSLVGLTVLEYEKGFLLVPTGDPTFLQPDFPKQPVYDFLLPTKKELIGFDQFEEFKAFGKGWAWDDYDESYMIERSSLPIFGNKATFSGTKDSMIYFPNKAISLPEYFEYSNYGSNGYINTVTRDLYRNVFLPHFDGVKKEFVIIPFKTSRDLAFQILADTLHKRVDLLGHTPTSKGALQKEFKIHSQPSDSLFKPMMHRSDNFFAEQTLLMASNEYLGYMSDEKIIDTILKTTLKDVPQKPRWVDGSGLSRYNLFTPKSFVYILNKTQHEFGWESVKNILPTGGTGTLSSYFKKDSGYIYAKTGTLSNNCALSGYLITKKGKLLIFSVLTNNYITGATPVRKAVEKFLLDIREKY